MQTLLRTIQNGTKQRSTTTLCMRTLASLKSLFWVLYFIAGPKFMTRNFDFKISYPKLHYELGTVFSPHCAAFPMCIAAKCGWPFVYCVIACVCFLVYSCTCILFYYVCITLVAGCWLEVSIRKVLRPATSAQVFLGFPVSKSECSYGSQDSQLLLHASHVALPT